MKYIMTIDDSPTIRSSVELSLKIFNLNVAQAENGEEGIEKIKTMKKEGDELALCIVDINMPKMDGITFVKEFRKIDSYTPVLILTTESEELKIKEGKDAGASGWIVKPFQTDELVNIVNRFIR